MRLFFPIMILCTMPLGLGEGTLVGCTPVFNRTGNIADQIFKSFLMFGLHHLMRLHHIYIYKLVQRYPCELPTIASVNEPT